MKTDDDGGGGGGVCSCAGGARLPCGEACSDNRPPPPGARGIDEVGWDEKKKTSY